MFPLAERAEELAQGVVEEPPVLDVPRPFLQDLQAVEADDHRTLPDQAEGRFQKVGLPVRFGRAEGFTGPEKERVKELPRVALLVEAPAEHPGERAAAPACGFLEPVADERGLASAADGADGDGPN